MIKDKVVVITGASSGIGEATSIELAKKGAKIVLSARRDERLKSIVEVINDQGGKAVYFRADVSCRKDVEGLASFAMEQYGHIDIWVNNAGIMPLSFINKLKVEEWDRMIDVNIRGILYGIAAAVPIMEKQKSGHIINVSSLAGHRVGLAGSIYSATKFAVRAITEGLRMELSHSANIRTTIISPGTVATELRATITDSDALDAVRSRGARAPLDSRDIAAAIVYAVEQPERTSINEIIIRPTT